MLRGQVVQLGSRGGTLGLSLVPLGSPLPTSTIACTGLDGESATPHPLGGGSCVFRNLQVAGYRKASWGEA